MYGTTTINEFSVFFLIVMIIFVLFLPRKSSFIPFIFTSVFITELQRIVILDIDFSFLRILVIFALLRLLARRETVGIKWSNLDYVFTAYTVISFMIFSLLYLELNPILLRFASILLAIGLFYFPRIITRNYDDFIFNLKIMSFASIVMAGFMLSEFYTGHNIFSVFGGVPEQTVVRNGRLRCQGAFIHPLMAGAYGGTLFPLFYILMIQKKALSRLFGVLGIAGSIVVTVLTASSGPVLSLFAGIIGLVAWPIRYHMKKIKLIVIFMLVFLHLVMKAPVWALVARVSTIDGSTGYHRFYLIDQAIKRFEEWWFLGTKSTAHWGYGLWDVTNQYVVEAVKGGFLGLILFLGVIISAFRIIGKSIENPDIDEQTKKTFWAMGSALFAHLIVFFGLAYFGGQSFLNFYFLLSQIGALSVVSQASYRSTSPRLRVCKCKRVRKTY